MDSTRELAWDGLMNVRDLGGLPMANGRVTKFHQVVRSGRDAMQKWPGFYVEVLAAFADAEGTVHIHCGRGHDRTGIVAALLLSLIGVPHEAVIRD
ncbi:hypothetical protein CVV68_22265 [Arthrobacter livingstonensis]|uniref:Tyrosine specific protein phosphatases domain-containing protein n=1 Tax=Arthrobacter livingstonensis TaxID=670078 RepID=A0A2V5KZS5_9MICC|nr:tyrosine-protein phosphatase [Arthrobacter livingstonensis]PYI64319.1 hypothetical protein CVV68_22265 [Arthrobacter livingstonensis]